MTIAIYNISTKTYGTLPYYIILLLIKRTI